MSNLVVVGFNNAADAFEMRGALAKMQAQYLIEMEDAVVVTRNETGAVQLHQAVNLTAAGAASGAFWGTLIGMLHLRNALFNSGTNGGMSTARRFQIRDPFAGGQRGSNSDNLLFIDGREIIHMGDRES